MSFFEQKEDSDLRRQVLNLRLELEKAGLLKDTNCPGCNSEAVVLTHVVVDPKKRENAYQLITVDTKVHNTPVALVCADCGRVVGTIVREREDFSKGARIAGLKNFQE